MAYNPQFNDIGSQFVQAYYQAYEAAANPEDRAVKLAGFYHVRSVYLNEWNFSLTVGLSPQFET